MADTVNITVLFTDMVGSTALSQRLSADGADEHRRAHFSILQSAIERAGGTMVKNLGDGVMAVFSSASSALGCAVSMQQSIEFDNRVSEHSVGLRVGLSVGEVTIEDADYFGDPVIEAARLCASAIDGQILADDLVRMMAGRRNLHECRTHGELRLKGLTEPVDVVEVLWEPLGDTKDVSVPLPDRLGVRPNIGSIVGYHSQVAELDAAFARVAAGEGREIVLVSGEAGQGKTTLAAEAARSAHAEGACVLFGHSEESVATPYQLFAEALRHYVTHAPEQHLRDDVAAHGPDLARLVPTLASRLGDLPTPIATDAESERFMLFAAVVGLLDEISSRQPLVLVFDDLQWADKASLLLLEHLAASDLATRILLIGTYRDSELAHSRALRETLGQLHRHRGVSRIELAGLDDTGVIEFLETAAGYTLNDDERGLAHALYRETDGNPFFVHQVLRHLMETGTIFQDGSGHWVPEGTFDDMVLPDSVKDVIGGRVIRLGPHAERILSVAAVIGRDFDLDLLAKATGIDEDELIDILEEAEAVTLVRESLDAPGHYNFAHALIQHTLYGELGPTKRARSHRQVAEALEVLCEGSPGARVGELARHWQYASLPSGIIKAVEYSRQAGDAALAGLAPADALRYYERAIELLDQSTFTDPALALDIAIGLGTAQQRVGDALYSATLIAAAREAAALDDTDRLVAAALANSRGWFSNFGAIDDDKVEVLEAALERLEPDDPRRAVILATYCLEIAVGSPLEQRQALATGALSIARSTGDDVVIVRTLNNVAYPLMAPQLLEQSLAWTAEALERLEKLNDPTLQFFAWHWRAQVVAQAGDLEERGRCLEAMRAIAARLNQPMLRWVYAIRQVETAIFLGDIELAEQRANEALTVGTEGGQPDAEFIYGAQLLVVFRQRGALEQLHELLETMASSTPSVADLLSGALAICCVEAGRLDEARARLVRFADELDTLSINPAWIFGIVWHAEVATEVADRDIAAVLFDVLAPYATQWATSGAMVESPICHSLGGLATILGRFDEADNYFAQSAAMCDHAGARFFTAQTDLLWGRMLLERRGPGDLVRSRTLLARARDAAVAAGYARVLQSADDALARLPE